MIKKKDIKELDHFSFFHEKKGMDELPINRASNPFKNQGYMMKLATQRGGDMLGRRSSGRRRQRRRQRGGGTSSERFREIVSPGYRFGKKLAGWFRRQRGGGQFSAAKVPIFGTLGTGYQIGKFLGKNLFKLLGMKMKKKYKCR